MAEFLTDNSKKYERLTLAVFVLSCILRIAYALASPYNISWHDLGFASQTGVDGTGHLEYINYIAKYHHLPDFDPRGIWSFCSPPLFHILSAVMLNVTGSWESLQIIPCISSCLTVWVLIRILDALEINGRVKVLLSALCAFHPFFMIEAVTVNPDPLAMLFMSLTVLFTVGWIKSPVMSRIIPVALCIGFGMAVKQNTVMIAFAVGAVFLYKFFSDIASWKKFVPQFVVFLVICVPIAFAYQIRNNILFNIPLTYTQPMDEQAVTGPQYVGGFSLWDRFHFPLLTEIRYPCLYYDQNIEYNVWTQLYRTALFDEISNYYLEPYFLVKYLFLALLWMSIVLSLIMTGMLCWALIKKKTMPVEMKLLCGISYAVMILLYVWYCFSSPYICTMNYRYIPIAFLFPVIGCGFWMKQAGSRAEKLAAVIIASFSALEMAADGILIFILKVIPAI